MELKEIYPKLYHLNFENCKDQAESMMRFQAHYDNPFFKGKYFCTQEFENWFEKKTEAGFLLGFEVFHDFANGFNFPSKILKPFYQNKFNPLTNQEKNLLKALKNIDKNSYIISSSNSEESKITLKHEIAHGLYYLNPDYKKEMIEILKDIPGKKRESMAKELYSRGLYHPSVYHDEIQAYLISDQTNFSETGIPKNELNLWSNWMNEVFKIHTN